MISEVYAFYDMEIVTVTVRKETEKMFFFDGCRKELGYVSKILKERAFTTPEALVAHHKKVFEFRIKHFNTMLLDARRQLKALREMEEKRDERSEA